MQKSLLKKIYIYTSSSLSSSRERVMPMPPVCTFTPDTHEHFPRTFSSPSSLTPSSRLVPPLSTSRIHMLQPLLHKSLLSVFGPTLQHSQPVTYEWNTSHNMSPVIIYREIGTEVNIYIINKEAFQSDP